LAGEELRAWLVPDFTETARQEAEHLLQEADTDKVYTIFKMFFIFILI
jgi:hypothetical protein